MFGRKRVFPSAHPQNGTAPQKSLPSGTESQTSNRAQYGQVGEGAPTLPEAPSQPVAPSNDYVTLTCSSCGGKLQIANEVERFACGYCGHEHFVRRQGGTVFLAAIDADSRQIHGGIDKRAAELAVASLSKEVDSLNLRYNDLSKRSNHEWLAPTLLEYLSPYLSFILPVVLLVAIASLLPEGIVDSTFSALDGLICTLFLLVPTTLIGSIVLLIKLRNKRLRQTNEIKSREITAVHNILQEKQELLEKNRKLVDS